MISNNDSNGADYYTEFTERTKKVAIGEECTLTAQGFFAKDPDNTFDGYQISYKKAKAKAAAFVEITDPETTSAVINKLSKKKKYTFKVRGYKTIDGQTVYGAWSAAKTIKIK